MRIYFSGSGSGLNIPEILIKEVPPCIMLSYYEIHRKDGGRTIARMDKHLANLQKDKSKSKNDNSKSRRVSTPA